MVVVVGVLALVNIACYCNFPNVVVLEMLVLVMIFIILLVLAVRECVGSGEGSAVILLI